MADTQWGAALGPSSELHTEVANFLGERRAHREQMPVHLLVVDNDPEVRQVCQAVGEECGLKVNGVGSEQEALDAIEMSVVDLLLTDLSLPGASGLDLLRKVSASHPDIAVVMLTHNGTMDSALEATRLGAADYVTKPFRVAELPARLEQVTRAIELKRENWILREQLRTAPGFGGLLGTSARMQRVYRIIEKVSQREHPVLILGESGTGKELVARSIHFSGSRKNKPFVPVDCSSLVPTLIESELFGYTKGAFTGAMQTKQGLIEAANGGTLFLDEIGDMPLEMQTKLLRALQQHEIKPVGSTDLKSINVRCSRNQSRSGVGGQEWDVPARPVFSAECGASKVAAVAGGEERYSLSDRVPSKEEIMPLEELERRAILSTLRQTGGDKQATARTLGIGKTTSYRKLKQYQIGRTDA